MRKATESMAGERKEGLISGSMAPMLLRCSLGGGALDRDVLVKNFQNWILSHTMYQLQSLDGFKKNIIN